MPTDRHDRVYVHRQGKAARLQPVKLFYRQNPNCVMQIPHFAQIAIPLENILQLLHPVAKRVPLILFPGIQP